MNVIQAFQMLNQIKTNPMGILSQKFNIPDGVNVNDPNEILKHLVESNQVTHDFINLEQCFSKCGPQISSAWEIVGNVNSQALPRPESEKSVAGCKESPCLQVILIIF